MELTPWEAFAVGMLVGPFVMLTVVTLVDEYRFKKEERLRMIYAPVCPRCLGYIPNNDTPGLYPGALSRADNHTEICSECGSDEARLHFLGRYVQPRTEWPITG
jgi:hypothetical protein